MRISARRLESHEPSLVINSSSSSISSSNTNSNDNKNNTMPSSLVERSCRRRRSLARKQSVVGHNRALWLGCLVLLYTTATQPYGTNALLSSSFTRQGSMLLSSPGSVRKALPVSSESEASEIVIPVEWDDEAPVDRLLRQERHAVRRRRQYHPIATSRSRLSVLSATSPTENSSSSSNNKSPHDIKQEFELHVGKALDTLREDYPRILTTLPDLSIYDRDIELVDPSGVKIHGIQTYTNSFRLMHALVKCLYCPGRSTMSFRMCFDKARRNIRIHWNVAVIPREIFGGSRTTLHVDGISVYELDVESGNIVQHRIEQLLINNMPVRPKEGVIAALRDEHSVSVPSFYQPDTTLHFQVAGSESFGPFKKETSLFAMEASESKDSQQERKSVTNMNNNNIINNDAVENKAAGSQVVASTAVVFDRERFDAKNKSRKKFGLKPLTEEQFMEIEVQVQRMDHEAKQRQAAAAAAAATAKAEETPASPSFFEKLFGNVLKDTCESNWDCERPQVCCDFGFKKMCCSSGSMVTNRMPQLALVPVPVEVIDPREPKPRNF